MLDAAPLGIFHASGNVDVTPKTGNAEFDSVSAIFSNVTLEKQRVAAGVLEAQPEQKTSKSQSVALIACIGC
jgi:hypothetical protein